MWQYVFTCAIGGMVGVAELVSRYRDEPLKLFVVPSAWLYILLNASASAAALLLARTYNWSLGATDPASISVTQVLLSGLGAMVVLRSHVFNLKVDGRDVPVGPSVLLVALLGAADRGVDRVRAVSRSKMAFEIMQDVSFNAARKPLATYSLSLLQNVSPSEQQGLSEAIDALARSDLTDTQKSLNLGLILMGLIGPAALRHAVGVHSPGILVD